MNAQDDEDDDDDKPIMLKRPSTGHATKRARMNEATMTNPFDMVPFALLLKAAKRGFHSVERKAVLICRIMCYWVFHAVYRCESWPQSLQSLTTKERYWIV